MVNGLERICTSKRAIAQYVYRLVLTYNDLCKVWAKRHIEENKSFEIYWNKTTEEMFVETTEYNHNEDVIKIYVCGDKVMDFAYSKDKLDDKPHRNLEGFELDLALVEFKNIYNKTHNTKWRITKKERREMHNDFNCWTVWSNHFYKETNNGN